MNEPTKQWKVKVGLAECTVSSATREEAVRKARAELCDRMPKFDLAIQNLGDQDFHVDPIVTNDVPVF